MKTRLSVARCCCDKPGQPGTVLPGYLINTWYPDDTTPLHGPLGTGPVTGVQLGERFGAYLWLGPIDVPQGAVITSAVIRADYEGGGTPFGGDADVRINAADLDNAPTQYTTNAQIIAAPRTSGVDWHIPELTYPPGSVILTPDLSTVFQDLVSRVGWSSGNRAHLFYNEARLPAGASDYRFDMVQKVPSSPTFPKLTITWA